MTYEQKYYNKMSPEEWRLYKLNTEIHYRRECIMPDMTAQTEVYCNFYEGLIYSFHWAVTPQGNEYWELIANRR